MGKTGGGDANLSDWSDLPKDKNIERPEMGNSLGPSILDSSLVFGGPQKSRRSQQYSTFSAKSESRTITRAR